MPFSYFVIKFNIKTSEKKNYDLISRLFKIIVHLIHECTDSNSPSITLYPSRLSLVVHNNNNNNNNDNNNNYYF